MPDLRVALCDDEPLALERLERMLKGLADVEVAGCFRRGEEFIAVATEVRADVAFVDIEMPKMDGFDVVENLSSMTWRAGREPPLIVFATAHPEFALQAFDTGALDFLAKPVRLSRLVRAVDRARAALADRQARIRLRELSSQLDELKRTRAHRDEEPHVWVRKDGQLARLDVATIDWVSAEGECVRFHTESESFLHRGTLSSVATQFECAGFLRIHRSAVVNAQRISSLSRTRWGALQIRLQSGPELRVSRSHEARVLQAVRGKSSPAVVNWPPDRDS